ncbi:hypothetical protein F5B22DRAFT_544122 [Xylaria bambusicola]|uniref:uncharacterized protein n=1 Tax=Xylaria bambusicola TaxID=326684 RepID=UPI002008C6C4|nr:uncharacterized protein F5B22DRAFT_544122 [Xylaria bambusicola]KAI0521585.1 hypothetical protein F5B22DRAFT_544122 [Xylaria bambusicola]
MENAVPRHAPVSGATLYAREIGRRRELRSRGVVSTGCSEIDDTLLLGGGFERGCVVGVSAEEVDFGVLLGLQTIARALVFEGRDASVPLPCDERNQRATIITTLPATTILPTLRDIVRYQVQVKLGPRHTGIDAELRRCLEAISISRIFDIEGLWEVLRELDVTQDKTRSPCNEAGNEEAMSPHVSDGNREEKGVSELESPAASSISENIEEGDSADKGLEQADADCNTVIPTEPLQEPQTYSPPERITELPPLRIGPELRPPVRKTEILDSEDEEPLSSSPLSSPPSTAAPESPSQSEEQQPQPPVDTEPPSNASSPDPEREEIRQTPEFSKPIPTEPSPHPIPDLILITHFSALLTTLFTQSDKPSAHTNLHLLSSHLRHLAREAGSLIMLLNTTTSPPAAKSTTTSTTTTTTTPDMNNNPIPPPTHTRPLDPTLRSIFNPPHVQSGGPSSYSAARRNKPAFGATFAQFLDAHLLCARIPRSRDDAEMVVALGEGGEGAWVVEMLLDEGLFWDWGGEGEGEGVPRRVNREQRWAAVDVRGRVVVVNAFASASVRGAGGVDRGPVRLAAGAEGLRLGRIT